MNKNWDAEIKQMVNRFLAWRLPQPWNPDNGISYQRPNYAHQPSDSDWPTGTNLFDATQAEAMVRHMLGLPTDAVDQFLDHAEKHGLMSEEQLAAEVTAGNTAGNPK
jgi:hypothetical protein